LTHVPEELRSEHLEGGVGEATRGTEDVQRVAHSLRADEPSRMDVDERAGAYGDIR